MRRFPHKTSCRKAAELRRVVDRRNVDRGGVVRRPIAAAGVAVVVDQQR